jgi:hypothetical protein
MAGCSNDSSPLRKLQHLLMLLHPGNPEIFLTEDSDGPRKRAGTETAPFMGPLTFYEDVSLSFLGVPLCIP